jgi:hypothetical protein
MRVGRLVAGRRAAAEKMTGIKNSGGGVGLGEIAAGGAVAGARRGGSGGGAGPNGLAQWKSVRLITYRDLVKMFYWRCGSRIQKGAGAD